MKHWYCVGLLVLPLAAVAAAPEAPDARAKKSPKKALRAFNDLIGTWRATGEPNGTREEKQRGFWQEKISWEWRFKGADAWLVAAFDKGKYFTGAELRYLPARDAYQLKAVTPAKETLTFEGKSIDATLENTDGFTATVHGEQAE